MDKKPDFSSIVLAGSDVVDSHPEEVNRLLGVLGSPEALVTDLSQISDFMIFLPNEEAMSSPDVVAHNSEILDGLRVLMGREVDPAETLGSLSMQLSAQSASCKLN